MISSTNTAATASSSAASVNKTSQPQPQPQPHQTKNLSKPRRQPTVPCAPTLATSQRAQVRQLQKQAAVDAANVDKNNNDNKNKNKPTTPVRRSVTQPRPFTFALERKYGRKETPTLSIQPKPSALAATDPRETSTGTTSTVSSSSTSGSSSLQSPSVTRKSWTPTVPRGPSFVLDQKYGPKQGVAAPTGKHVDTNNEKNNKNNKSTTTTTTTTVPRGPRFQLEQKYGSKHAAMTTTATTPHP